MSTLDHFDSLEITSLMQSGTLFQNTVDLITQQAQKNPRKIALKFNQFTLDYGTLNTQANQLAHCLKRKGQMTQTIIAISLSNPIQQIISLLAVWKLGAIYLPIDLNYPKERIAYLLNDSNVNVLMTDTRGLQKFSHFNLINIILLNLIELQSFPTDSLTAQTNADLAYVLYTSGSTGLPKGVMATHQNLISIYLSWQTAYQLNHFDRHLQMASFSFDVSIGNIVRALCSGATLVLCPPEILLQPDHLYRLLKIEMITVAEFVPTVLRKLINYLEVHQFDLGFMRLMICGSDDWTMQEYIKFKRYCSKRTRLINSYGVTEATIDSTYFETNSTQLDCYSSVPIGQPFSNTQIFLLDEQLKPIRSGIGEIYIGGLGVARGYLNQPDLTKEKFITHCFTGQSIRLYKTGDLGKILHNGHLIFCTRVDHQHKIRGHRIELNEIKQVLSQYGAIAESVVTAYKSPAMTEKILVAFLNLKDVSEFWVENFLAFLKRSLPKYSIPTWYLCLSNLPISPHGKLDAQSLIASYCTEQLTLKSADQEETIESILMRLFKNLLGIKNITHQDCFFDLGINSLLLIELLATLERTFNIQLNCDEISNLYRFKDWVSFIRSCINNKNNRRNHESSSSTARQAF
jgi:amino acid adenylation domain-containing protein